MGFAVDPASTNSPSSAVQNKPEPQENKGILAFLCPMPFDFGRSVFAKEPDAEQATVPGERIAVPHSPNGSTKITALANRPHRLADLHLSLARDPGESVVQ